MAAGGHKADSNSKEEHKKLSTSKEKEKPNSSESHVEMDSRLLTALLTVSMNNSEYSIYHIHRIYLISFSLNVLFFPMEEHVSFCVQGSKLMPHL